MFVLVIYYILVHLCCRNNVIQKYIYIISELIKKKIVIGDEDGLKIVADATNQRKRKRRYVIYSTIYDIPFNIYLTTRI